MLNFTDDNTQKEFDPEFQVIADYLFNESIYSTEAIETAYYVLLDSLGCGFLALNYPECVKMLGPVVPGTMVPHGVPIPGTQFILDPILAAFNIGTMIRWLDFNDTWLAKEWGHPSDNLGAILAVADYISRKNIATQKSPLTIKDILKAMIKAHEIQGIFALENSFNQVGLDHVILVKLASTAVTAKLLGLSREQILNALSNVFVDGQSLRTYRHAPNTGSRKSWAAGDATSRGVWLAMAAQKGEMGYPTALSAPKWGFYDVTFKGEKFKFPRKFSNYVMENVLFKVSYPAEFHAQTAVECAVYLHPFVKDKLNQIERIEIMTHQSAIRIISKTGTLHNPADRDHCLQYMVAVALLTGNLTAENYENAYAAAHPDVNLLREKMQVSEDIQFSKDYLDPEKRSIANSMQIYFTDGTKTEKITVEYPIGHKRRRKEAYPLILTKFKNNITSHFNQTKAEEIYQFCVGNKEFQQIPINQFLDLLQG